MKINTDNLFLEEHLSNNHILNNNVDLPDGNYYHFDEDYIFESIFLEDVTDSVSVIEKGKCYNIDFKGNVDENDIPIGYWKYYIPADQETLCRCYEVGLLTHTHDKPTNESFIEQACRIYKENAQPKFDKEKWTELVKAMVLKACREGKGETKVNVHYFEEIHDNHISYIKNRIISILEDLNLKVDAPKLKENHNLYIYGWAY